MTTQLNPVERLLGRLQGVRQTGDRWEARCPAHRDRKPSLSVSCGDDGRALVRCHAGCDIKDVVAAVDLEMKDLFREWNPSFSRGRSESGIQETYDYHDLDGVLRFQVCRLKPRGDTPKSFRQRRPHAGTWAWGLAKGWYKLRANGAYSRAKRNEPRDGSVKLPAVERILYRLKETRTSIEAGDRIILCEGEKDAENGASLGLATTTNPGGAGKWHKSYSESLRGARVAIIPDNDDPGRQSAEKIAAELNTEGIETRIVDLGQGQAKGYDLSDWIADRRRDGLKDEAVRSEFMGLIEGAQRVQPKEEQAPTRPHIKATTREMSVVDQGEKALSGREEIFHRGGLLVQVVREDVKSGGILRSPCAPTIQPVQAARIRELLSDAAVWTNVKGKEIHPPLWAVQALLARGIWPLLKPLEGVVETPVLRPDGSILDTPGYDAETGLLFLPRSQEQPIPELPGHSDAKQAAQLLLEAVDDFPFATLAHRSAWLSCVLTLLARYAFGGPAPLHLVDANVRGAGKSLLVDAASVIALGRASSRMSPSENEAEERKRITALALAGDSLILIDNVAGALGSASLDAALTGTTWTDRLLGQSVRVTLPLKAIWMATGNNVLLKGDLCRRCLHIRLDSPEEFPERREGFRHPRLLEWIEEHRPRLAAAGLTLLRAFCVAGRPDQGLPAWGSFESWSALVRNAIVWAGQPDPGETREVLQTQADRDHEILDRLLTGWQGAVQFFGRPIAVSEVLSKLEEEGTHPELESLRATFLDLCSSPGRLPSSRQLGNRLQRFQNRVIRGRSLQQRGRGKFGMRWVVEAIETDPALSRQLMIDPETRIQDTTPSNSEENYPGGL